jgi:hypothetical protein
MKLIVMWMLGVPLAVGSMVALPTVGHRLASEVSVRQAACLKEYQHDVRLAITQQRHRIACRAHAVK